MQKTLLSLLVCYSAMGVTTSQAADLSLDEVYAESASDILNEDYSNEVLIQANIDKGLTLAAEALASANSSYTLALEASEAAGTASGGTINWTGTYNCTASYSVHLYGYTYTDSTSGTYSATYSTTSIPNGKGTISVSAKKISGMSTNSDFSTPSCVLQKIVLTDY